MTFSIHPATIADIPAIVTLSHAAFKDDRLVGYLARDVAPDLSYAHHCQEYERRFKTSALNGLVLFKAVDDDTGETVGVTRWQFPYTLNASQRAEKDALKDATSTYPPGYNEKLRLEIYSEIDKFEGKWVDESRDYVLLGLAVAPTYQRRGVGSLLLRNGLAVADAAGAKTYLESSTAGAGLYVRHGFRQVDELAVDMRPYGGEGVERCRCMVKEAGGEVGR